MKVNVVPIGNSKGIRIPKAILQQCHIEKEVELEVENEKVIVSSIKKEIRKNWDSQFKNMSKKKEDRLLIDDTIDLDSAQWEW